MQEPNSFVTELCGYTLEWDEGWMEPCQAIPGSSIAAVGSAMPPISVYYQGPDNAIYEKKDTNVWQVAQKLVCDAMALTAISAVSFKSAPFPILFDFSVLIVSTDMDEMRLYYQDSNFKIRELRLAAGSWMSEPSSELPIEVPSRTSIASVSWNDGSEIRLYVQDGAMDIVEWCYDDRNGWRTTEFRTAARQGTDIAATSAELKEVALIWLFYHGVDDVLQVTFFPRESWSR